MGSVRDGVTTASRGQPPAGAPVRSEQAAENRKITTHRLLATPGAGAKALDLLHRDLFDSRSTVVVSALKAIASVGDPASIKYVVRILNSTDREVRLEGVRTIGALRSTTAPKLLADLYKTARDDEVRCEAFRAFARSAPSDPQLRSIARELTTSDLASDELRACAVLLLLGSEDAEPPVELFAGASEETIETILADAVGREELYPAILTQGAAWYDRFSSTNRKLLVAVAASESSAEAVAIILRSIDDGDPEVRYSGYRALAGNPSHAPHLAAIVERLFDRFESSFTLEDEAIAAIDRLETACASQSIAIDSSTLLRLRKRSSELFEGMSAPDRRPGSATMELGWLIVNSREYLEYYSTQGFRQALVHYLKGGSYHGAGQMLAMLKRTAERVEVRHFDGYRALAEIIQNPQRPGISLITRELSIAKLDKLEPFGRLIRNLRLMRLALDAPSETVDFAARVFIWARGRKLFRLAEAALSVLAKFSPTQAEGLCHEQLSLPVQSKILAIGSIRLMKSLGTEPFMSSIESLLANADDSHILLNLLDALSSPGAATSAEVLKAAVKLTYTAGDSEVVREAVRYLTSSSIANVLETITYRFEGLEEWRQSIILEALDRLVEESETTKREGIAEFLYKILRSRESGLKGSAAVLLWKLGDEFALKILDRLLKGSDNEARGDIVRGLKGYVNKAIASILLPLLGEEQVGLQEAVRETLLAVVDADTRDYIRDRLTGSSEPIDEEEAAAPRGESEIDEEAVGVNMLKEKQAYRFEHEFVNDLAIFFTDMEGYSSKAQSLTTMQLTSLIHDYEGILLPIVSAHRGALIKKMGDGHLFSFESALDAGLAALRLQKALKRFNRYREEAFRVIIRIGIHWGRVVQRDGDILGNHVNIASRLESAAKGGSILVSRVLYEQLGEMIHARQLGKIMVKGITEPIQVYEPYEIQIDLPEELDPLKSKGKKLTTQPIEQVPDGSEATPPTSEISVPAMPENRPSATDPIPREAGEPPSAAVQDALDTFAAQSLDYLSKVFASLDGLCKKAENREVPLSLLRTEITKEWSLIREHYRSVLHVSTEE